jgi:diadenylate cyclase
VLADPPVFFYLFEFIPFTLISLIDILVVGFFLYQVLGLVRGTRAAQMLVGLFVVVTLALAAPWLQLKALGLVLEQVRPILLILLVILFQPELRRMLLELGQSPILRWFYKREPSQVIDGVVAGAMQLADRGYGALIVLVREVRLEPIIETGVRIEGEVSADLLVSIFTPRAPLHDQAVIIQGEKLVAARCTLPLAEDIEDERLGTRHRAALGLSQETDAVTIVVSEESSNVSLAIGGALVRGVDANDLKKRLIELMTPREGKVPGVTE